METHDAAAAPGTDPAEAREALRAATEAEQRGRALVPAPRWYAPAYGALVMMMPAYTALLGAGQGIAAAGLMLLYVAGLGALVGAYRRTAGLWPRRTGLTTTLAMAAMVALLVVTMTTAFAATRWWDLPWLAVAAVVLAGAGAAAGIRALDRARGARSA